MQLWSQRSGQGREILQAPRDANAGSTLGGRAVRTHPTRRPRLQVRLEDSARRTFSGPPPAPPSHVESCCPPAHPGTHSLNSNMWINSATTVGRWRLRLPDDLRNFWNRRGGSQHGPDLHPLLTSPRGFASGNLQPLRNPAAASPCT